jgi:hypothetical protein
MLRKVERVIRSGQLSNRRKLYTAAIAATAASASAAYVNRRLRLRNDRVVNPLGLPVLDHIEKHKDSYSRVPRWETADTNLLAIAKYFPAMPINQKILLPNPNPNPKPISILPLRGAPTEVQEYFTEQKGVFIGVGGPLPAVGVFQKSVEGEPAILITNGEMHRKPADHIQTDAVNETPAYTAGKTVPWFIRTQIREFLMPSRLDTDVPKAGFNVFSLNVKAWLENPAEWSNGIKVAWGNYQLSRHYDKDQATGIEPPVWEYTRKRMRASRAYLEALSDYQPGILRPSYGSLTVVTTPKATAGNESDSHAFKKEGLEFKRVTAAQAEAAVGFVPQGADSFWLNSHDRIAHDDFRHGLNVGIKAHGGQVITGDVTAVYDDTEHNRGGVIVYQDKISGEVKNCKYTRLVLSVGNTQFTGPNKRAEIAVAGISSDIIVFDLPKRTLAQEIPIVIDGPTHIIPQQTQIISDVDPVTGEKRERTATWYRLTTGGDVRPLVGSDGSFHPHHAAHAIHRVSETLPKGTHMAVVRVEECLRIIDEGALQTEKPALVSVDGTIVQSKNITISGVAGGGGLTAMGVLQGPREVAILESKLAGNTNSLYGKVKLKTEGHSPSSTAACSPR